MTVGTQQFGLASTPPSSNLGNNQMGIGGAIYYSNIQPWNNWIRSANGKIVALTFTAGFITSIVAHPVLAGWVQATTSSPHGLYNPDWSSRVALPTDTGGSGGLSFQILNVKDAGGSSLAGWAITGNSSGVVDGASTISWQASVGTGTVAKADLIVTLSGNIAPNAPSSLLGHHNNLTQYVDANGDVQNSIPNVASIVVTQTVYALDFANLANVPTGFSRTGQKFSIQWAVGTGQNSTANGVGNATSPATVDFTWNSSLDATNVTYSISIPNSDIANVPKLVYYGPNNPSVSGGELGLWNSGRYWQPAFENFHLNTCGTVRFMDMCNTNANLGLNNFSQWTTPNNASWLGGDAYPSACPMEAMLQFCNRTNKDPWLNIQNSFTFSKGAPIMGISKSSPGSNAIVTFATPGGYTNLGFPFVGPFQHPFNTGDNIIIAPQGTGSGNPLVTNTSATMTISTSTIGWTAHGFPAGQNIIFVTAGGGVNTGQSYYVTSGASLLANSFQVSSSLANALDGVPITLTGSNATVTARSQIFNCQFVVGAVTAYTAELLHCDSSSFGSVATTFNGIGQYAIGNSVVYGAMGVSPFDLTHYTSQVTAMVTAVNSTLNANLRPHWEYANECWNVARIINPILTAQAHNFVDTNGARYFGDSYSSMHGYFLASGYNAIRTFYGGSSGRAKWVGNLGVKGGTPSETNLMFSGMDKWILDNNPSLTRNDLIDNIATRTYWGPIYQSNGNFIPNFSSTSTFTIDPSGIAATTITVPSNSNAPFAPNLWAYPFLPIIMASGNFPNDLATGQPLVSGAGSQLGVYTTVSVSGVTGGIATISNVSGPSLTVGMTIYPSLSNGGGSYWKTPPIVITAMSPSPGLSGAGGTGTYQVDSGATLGAYGGSAYDYTGSTGIYWGLPTDPNKGCFGRTFRFASKNNMARFGGFISNGSGGAGNTLTVTTPPLVGQPQIAIGNLCGGVGVTECTITGGSGTTWTVSGSPQLTTNLLGMGAYTPVICDPANPGSGTLIVLGGASTLLRNYANDSIALNKSNPATYPNRYSYYNFKINEQLSYFTDGFAGAPVLAFNAPPTNTLGLSSFFVTDMTPILPPNLNSKMPTSPGMVAYEGGNGNNPQGLVTGTNNTGFQHDPQFAEFIQSACCTTEAAAVWTLMFNTWKLGPTYAAQAPYSFTGTGSLVMGQLPFFVDAINVTATFQFTGLYFVDDIVGIGSPNWQQPLNGHPYMDALAATN